MKDFIGDYIEVTVIIIVCMALVIFTLVSINKSYKKIKNKIE